MTLVPLILAWMFARNNQATQQGSLTRKRSKKAPKWPTPNSPPPMPAFKPQPSAHDASTTATPLAALHNAPPSLAPASSTEPSHLATPTAIKNAALSAYKKKATSLLKQRLFSTPTATTVSVANLQKILNQRGAKLQPDGLYGPRTASAWQRVAKSKGLPSTIARASGTTAKVASQTYDALSVPPIP